MAAPVGLALQFIRKAMAQFDTTCGSVRHGKLVRDLFAPGQVRNDIEQWLLSGGENVSTLLLTYQQQLSFVRTNETSGEALHRQGTLVHNKAANHSPVEVPTTLRSPQLFGHFKFGAIANMFKTFKSELGILKKFQLD